ncbi:MAG: aryl-sulfate sulfotransferase N-terminal domain-containing protein [Clostridiales bacterium]|nr:aryl-sulfate sulfotransferase N-terminal domain-containing protein [Clostridiales bacterium]
MLKAGLHQNRSKRPRLIIIISLCITMFLGCSKGNVESPNNSDNIWGFGNVVKNESNTFDSNPVSIADPTTFNYVNQEDFTQLVKGSLSTSYEGIYRSNYQQEALAQIVQLKEKRTYSTDHPLFVHNPFGTNSSSLYVYFGTPTQRIVLYYTVSASDSTIPDFSDTMYMDATNTQDLEGQIIGLVSGQKNKIVLDVRDDAGNKISKKAYIIDVPQKESFISQRLTVETSGEMEYTRGLFTYLVKDQPTGYFVFYDNNGILRSEIPTSVQQTNARIVQADNMIFYEYEDNEFALVNNLGFIVQTYSYNNGENIVDYDYDASNKLVVAIVEDSTTKAQDKVYSLNLTSGDWIQLVDFKKILRKLPVNSGETEEEASNQDWIGLNYIYSVQGKDIIVLSQELDAIFRINNVYSQPVIRWIIGNEEQWNGTNYESLLLAKSGNMDTIDSIDSLNYTTSKKLKDQQFYLSFLNFNGKIESSPKVTFGRYLIDENQNRYRIQQSLDIVSERSKCSAIGYGTHTIIALWDNQFIIEYNTKGEIMLKMTLPNTNSSYRIYKYTMDRYWF